jgi:hypothetical protein
MIIKEDGNNRKHRIIDSLFFGSQLLFDVDIMTSASDGDPISSLEGGEGLLGYEVLKHFYIILDYKNNMLYLKPQTETIANDTPSVQQ